MSAPALIYLVLIAHSLGIGMEKHGKPRTGNHSFGWQFISAVISCGLLYWGGFFAAVKP
jgi:hypothetical protein